MTFCVSHIYRESSYVADKHTSYGLQSIEAFWWHFVPDLFPIIVIEILLLYVFTVLEINSDFIKDKQLIVLLKNQL